MKLNLFSHNKAAYEAVINLLEEAGKAAVIHPTGTGKSFVAFELAMENPDKKVLWLAPSEYIYKTQQESLAKLMQADANATTPSTANHSANTSTQSTADHSANATTPSTANHSANVSTLSYINPGANTTIQNPTRIKIAAASNITFMTYQKLMLNEESISKLCPDYIILDEFHRCGATEWGKSVSKLIAAFPEAKLLGLSATNIRYLDNHRNMADELFDGNIASEMTLGEAIVRKILPSPEYVVSIYSYKKEIEKLEKCAAKQKHSETKAQRNKNTACKDTEELLSQLKRNLENAAGLPEVFGRHMKRQNGKYIVFCTDKEHMAEMIKKSGEWFSLVDKEPHVYGVYYDNPETSKEFAAFKEDKSEHLKLLYCIDMLNEGVHVEDIDGVILLRPTVSPILYLQQIGRCLSTGGNKEPVIFDIVNNFENIYSIDTIKAEMEEAFEVVGCSAFERQKFMERFHISEEVKECRRLFEAITKNLSVTWEMYYLKAKAYYEAYGNLKIPKTYRTDNGLSLGAWLVTQRRVYNKKAVGNLTQEQIEKLTAIGMEWEPRQEANFERGLSKLAEYKAVYGNADVKASYITPEGFALGKWISNIRSKGLSAAGLTKEQRQRLDELGMIWDKAEYQWRQSYNAAKEYYIVHGNLDVPRKFETKDGFKLGIWLANQRTNYAGNRKGAAMLKEWQIDALNSIGMIWDTSYDVKWDDYIRLATEFYDENGHLDVPYTYSVNGVQLGKWIASVRQKRQNPSSSGRSLTKERIKQLDNIGMIWNKDSWDIRFKMATEYYRQHGDLHIPADFVTKEHIWLGKWVYEQRKRYQNSTLSSDRKLKLEQIGIDWR